MLQCTLAFVHGGEENSEWLRTDTVLPELTQSHLNKSLWKFSLGFFSPLKSACEFLRRKSKQAAAHFVTRQGEQTGQTRLIASGGNIAADTHPCQGRRVRLCLGSCRELRQLVFAYLRILPAAGASSHLVGLHGADDVFDSTAAIVGHARHAHQPPRSGQGGGGGEEAHCGG